ncbi:filamentous hemagglutinin N-terminal domain-containing protein [Methylomonas sp. MO1]|uniref:two-partner secretion domain-containing protein n=1 Tax=Methylomonas sp. MO1 TaxID=3073619 RepID=UPI0028A2F0E9|nr:filamentous hemagglutinin N-terminal domain-containing protein [Methylomonas sp. MO1]MDT4291943.1 filamentous hemagglutinin N-terminal domain-containing protein [Methylomonas sp. MO1]
MKIIFLVRFIDFVLGASIMSSYIQTFAWLRILAYCIFGMMFPVSFSLAVDVNNIAIDPRVPVANYILTNGQNNTIVEQNSGNLAGHNLFFSFSKFNIGSGNTVTFSGNSSDTISNVISRVTGGTQSSIDGTLRSNIGHASFYFINPNGIALGPNAQLNVPGAFHVSTADKIEFKNGGIFYADPNLQGGISLPNDDPVSLGFLATNSANNGLIDIHHARLNLNLNPSQNNPKLDIVAGEIQVTDQAILTAEAGEIRMVAMQEQGSVSLVPNNPGYLPLPEPPPLASNAGVINIDQSAIITSGDGGGRISIYGDNVSFANGGTGRVDNTGSIASTSAKGIQVVSNVLSLNGGSSNISTGIHSEARSSVKSGDISVWANTLEILNRGQIETVSRNAGKSGDILVNVNNTLTINRGDYTSDSATGIRADSMSSGNSGDITVNAGTMNILNGGSIANVAFSSGDAGFIKITSNNLTIDSLSNTKFGTGIYSSALKLSTGNAGNINVTTNTLTIDSLSNTEHVAGIDSSAFELSTGNAGLIKVNANTLDIFNAGIIRTSTAGTGDAGTININASYALNIGSQGTSHQRGGILSESSALGSGNAGEINVQAGTLNILSGGQISTSTHSRGNAGEVNVSHVRGLTIDQGGSSLATGIMSITGPDQNIVSNNLVTGNAGIVNVQADNMDIRNGGTISSFSQSLGQAGVVNIAANTLLVHGGGYISSASLGSGSSGETGNISIVANDWLHLTDGGYISVQNDAIVPENRASTIHPGNIAIRAPDILMRNSSITSASTGNIAAGNISLIFSHWLTLDPSYISTMANTGNGGSIFISGGELVSLQNSGFLTSVNGANSNGGDISVTANLLIMDTGVIQANAIGGSGGNILLNLGGLIPSNDTLIMGGSPTAWQPFISGLNVIQAVSETGVSGTLNVTAPQLNLSGVLANLGGPQFDTSIFSQDYCGLSSGSTLTRIGRGGLLPKGGDLQIY